MTGCLSNIYIPTVLPKLSGPACCQILSTSTKACVKGGCCQHRITKRYNNPLLLQLEERYSDVKIINLPHITVADDLAVMSRSYGAQQIKIWDVDDNTCRERFCVNPGKSSTLCYPFDRKSSSESTDIFMVDDKISNDQSTHLGIHRDISDKPCIEEKITLGRKTAYSLMGAGFHSGNGLKVSLNGFIWSTYVLPRVVYGLEALILRK